MLKSKTVSIIGGKLQHRHGNKQLEGEVTLSDTFAAEVLWNYTLTCEAPQPWPESPFHGEDCTVDGVICKKTFLKPLRFWFASSSDDLIKTFEVFCPSFLNFHDNSLAIPIYFLHSLELKQRQEVWVKAWLRPEADTSVTCWRDAAELFAIHLCLRTSKWALQKWHCENQFIHTHIFHCQQV